MLYDELVPDGKYLAHYGVPKDQWSAEARARHNRNHPQKADATTEYLFIKNLRRARDAYDEYRNDNYNRGGHRSTFESKVDEQRAQLAETRHRNRSQHTGDQGNKPNSGQHTPNYRKPRTSSYKTPGANAKPGRGRSSGKPSESSSSGYNPLRARFTRRPDPSINEVEAERRTNTSIRPNRSAGKKPNSGKRAGNGKNHSALGYYNPDPHLQDRVSTPIRRTERSQAESVRLYDRASGEAAARFHNDVASRGGGYRNYTHHGQHVHQGPVGSGRTDVLFNKLKPAKDKSGKNSKKNKKK